MAIMGGGLSGLSLAFFLQNKKDIEKIYIFEKESEPGGLCRSFDFGERKVDIGPHIFFSKDKATLDFMLSILGENKDIHRRSNRIIYKGNFIQYPFENDLSSLPAEDCEICVDTFIHNPYRKYDSQNMLQFFLKTFGEGITDLYLRPYNEKIWKFDPVFMNTKMVDRIPQPPDEDILRSARGETVDGYLHQLYFYYPKEGATESLIRGLVQQFNEKVTIVTNIDISKIIKERQGWILKAQDKEWHFDKLASCIPVNEFVKLYEKSSKSVLSAAEDLKFNHIMLAMAELINDKAGENYAFMIPDKDVIFHRLSKVDFLGENYSKGRNVAYMMEFTYRDNDYRLNWSEERLCQEFIKGLKQIKFIESSNEVKSMMIRKFPYAYVVYDMKHEKNMKRIRLFFEKEGVFLNGRFGNFEYWNMDRVIKESKILADHIINEEG